MGTFFNEYWVYTETLLAYQWDVMDLLTNMRARPEFLRASRNGPWRLEEHGGTRWRCMLRANGFFADNGDFIEDSRAGETLLMKRSARMVVYALAILSLVCLLALNILTTLLILVFQMLTQQARQFEEVSFLREHGGSLCAVMLTVQVIGSATLYKRIAVALTDLENQRTELEYEDSLLLKTTLFQFVNSYFAPFYLALVKSRGQIIFNSFGYTNLRGEAYMDFCGSFASAGTPYAQVVNCSTAEAGCSPRYLFVREDCLSELQTLMVSYLVLKPILENLQTLLLPALHRLVALWKRVHRRKGANKVGTVNEREASENAGSQSKRDRHIGLAAQVSDEMTLATPDSTFSEFNTKVLQFGYVAFFSVAFPLGSLAAAVTNVIELRLDAHKFTWACRRPTWQGADGISNWKLVLRVYTWLALLVNVFLLTYATNGVRDYIVIPAVSELRDDECPPALTSDLLSDEARGHGLNVTWRAGCVRNYRNCFTDIGAVAWLPALDYLDSSYEVSQSVRSHNVRALAY